MIPLRYNTASQEVPLGFFVDSTDGNTEETALSIANTDIWLWKAGATSLANKNSGGGTHIQNGVYYAVLDATDCNTIGPLVIYVHKSGALPVKLECIVYPAEVFDYLFAAAGTDYMKVDVGQWNGTNVASPATAGYPVVTVKVGTGTGEINLSSGAAPVTGDLTATMKTSVNTEVLDVLNVDTFAEPGQEAPGATVSLVKKIGYLYKAWRNKKTQTSGTFSLFNDDAATVDQKATVTDDGSTFTKGEIATGP